jgi:hypothetical protein
VLVDLRTENSNNNYSTIPNTDKEEVKTINSNREELKEQ